MHAHGQGSAARFPLCSINTPNALPVRRRTQQKLICNKLTGKMGPQMEISKGHPKSLPMSLVGKWILNMRVQSARQPSGQPNSPTLPPSRSAGAAPPLEEPSDTSSEPWQRPHPAVSRRKGEAPKAKRLGRLSTCSSACKMALQLWLQALRALRRPSQLPAKALGSSVRSVESLAKSPTPPASTGPGRVTSVSCLLKRRTF